MGLIYSAITGVGGLKREAKKGKNFNICQDQELRVELSDNSRKTKKKLVENAIANLETDCKLKVKQLKAQQDMSDGRIFMKFSVIGSFISAIFSICGLNGVKHIGDCFEDIPATMVTIVFAFFAFLNISISYYDTLHNEYYYNQASKLKAFQIIFTVTSISSNIIFLRLQGISLILSTVLSILLDTGSIFCSEVANCRKYKNKSTKQLTATDKAGAFEMLKVIITNPIMTTIRERYNAILNESKNVPYDGKKENIGNNVLTDYEAGYQKLHDLRRTSASKMTKDKMLSIINKMQSGTVITPKMLGMQGNKNFYNWVANTDMINKIDNKYIKA